MPSRDWLNRNVAGMTLTSLLSDACYEMIISVLPGFLAAVGISPAALGWIEGAADALSSFLKLWAGWYSDHIGKRKLIVVLGYFFTGTGMSLFALATGWPMILFGRMVSWLGKGIRGSLRDAMLSESVPGQFRDAPSDSIAPAIRWAPSSGRWRGSRYCTRFPHRRPTLLFA